MTRSTHCGGPSELLVNELHQVWHIHRDHHQFVRVLIEAFTGPAIRDYLEALPGHLATSSHDDAADTLVMMITAAHVKGHLRLCAPPGRL